MTSPLSQDTGTLSITDITGRSMACNLATEASDLTLPHIVVHLHSQRCLCCGVTHRWSSVYECHTKGKMKSLLPARRASEFPIDYTILPVTLPCDPVLVCHLCVGQSGTTDAAAHQRWKDTLARKAAQSSLDDPTAPRHTSRPSSVPTLDQL